MMFVQIALPLSALETLSSSTFLSNSLLLIFQTLLVAPNILAALGSMDCSKNIYFGTAAGATHYFERYFRGLGYALSWPLVSSKLTSSWETRRS